MEILCKSKATEAGVELQRGVTGCWANGDAPGGLGVPLALLELLLEVSESPWSFWRCKPHRAPSSLRAGAVQHQGVLAGEVPAPWGALPKITCQHLLAPLLPEITPPITLRRAGLSHDGSIHLLGSAPRSPAPSSSLQRETEALGMDT